MTSLVLGIIALLLFFLPILGVPLSLCGIAIGLVALFASLAFPGVHLRWALAGLATSCLALAINLEGRKELKEFHLDVPTRSEAFFLKGSNSLDWGMNLPGLE